MQYDESPYLKALTELNSDDFEEKEWLFRNFELFKTTLNWPDRLPPINRTLMDPRSLRHKFNATYREILGGYDHILEQQTKTLKIK